MSSAPFMQLYVADYLADTQHLSTEQHGAYLLLLMSMWRAGGSLPANDKILAKVAQVTPSRWHKIAPLVMPFFDEIDGQITQKRLSKEHEKAILKSQLRKQIGALGGTAKALKDKDQALPKATDLLWHSSESDIIKKERTPIVPKGTGRSKRVNGHDPKLYEEFEMYVWGEFPRHPGSRKDPAFKKYADLPSELRSKCIGGVARYSQRFDDEVDPKRTKPERLRYVPHLVTWINQKG